MFVVDTNVLIYAADRSCPEHERCRDLLESWRRQRLPWYLTWSIVYEFLRVTTHPRVFRQPWSSGDSWSFIAAVLASPGLGVLEPTAMHAEIAARTIAQTPGLRGNLFHDCHIAILMRENGVRRIYTRDTDFHRFPFLEVLDPLLVD